MRKFKIGLALGGGGVRGLAHAGILSVLEENGIVPDIIAGTSMGSVIGAMYAGEPDAEILIDEIENFFSESILLQISVFFSRKNANTPLGRVISFAQQFFILNRSFRGVSILSEKQVEKIFSQIPIPGDFNDLKIPFCAVSADIGKGVEADFWSGDLKKAVLASSAIQGIFPPVEIKGSYYLDGAIVCSIPINPLLGLCDFVIACDVRSKSRVVPHFKNGLEILSRADSISQRLLSDLQLEKADFVFRPDVSGVHWANFKRFGDCIEHGKIEARTKIGKLKKLIKTKKLKTFPKRIFKIR
ncbi:MAG: patatin-like phospholipase family protein [Elusimicrobia bacterium]|nr:patatin-like phospholipase family protein [Elusimicrobiota bacterium]